MSEVPLWRGTPHPETLTNIPYPLSPMPNHPEPLTPNPRNPKPSCPKTSRYKELDELWVAELLFFFIILKPRVERYTRL